MRIAWMAAAAAALAAGAPARADVAVTSRSGLWSAYGGTAADQRQECGIATADAEQRRIDITQNAGETSLGVVVSRDQWAIPANTQVVMRLSVDGGATTTVQGMGDGQAVSATMPFAQTVPFMRGVRYGAVLQVAFAQGNEPPWSLSLAGSSQAIDAFNACRRTLPPPGSVPTAPPSGAPTQPFAPAPAAPAAPTQPFAPTPQ